MTDAAVSGETIEPGIPTDDMKPIPVPAQGTDQFDQYVQNCSLNTIATYSAIVLARPAAVQPAYETRGDALAPLTIDIKTIVNAEPGTDLKAGTPLTVLAASFKAGTYAGSGVNDIWPNLRGDYELVLLYTYPDAQYPWNIRPIKETAGGLTFYPDLCNFAASFKEVARRLDRQPTLDLLTDLATEIRDIQPCLAAGGSNETCIPPMFSVADRVIRGQAELAASDPDSIWTQALPSRRSIAFADVPADIAPQLMLVGFHISYVGDAPDVVYSISCDLGVGFEWKRDALSPVLPVSTCRKGPTIFNQEVGTDSTGFPIEQELGRIEPTELSEALGTSVTIDFTGTKPRLVVTTLHAGDLQKLLNITSDQLAQLRNQYSTPTTTDS